MRGAFFCACVYISGKIDFSVEIFQFTDLFFFFGVSFSIFVNGAVSSGRKARQTLLKFLWNCNQLVLFLLLLLLLLFALVAKFLVHEWNEGGISWNVRLVYRAEKKVPVMEFLWALQNLAIKYLILVLDYKVIYAFRYLLMARLLFVPCCFGGGGSDEVLSGWIFLGHSGAIYEAIVSHERSRF